MHVPFTRPDGRLADQLRPLSLTYDVFPYAAGSVLFCMGNTRVLCAVSLQPGVPSFLRGKGTGWLTAEYALLPASTRSRCQREAVTGHRQGRSVEISRLIGRALRSIVDFSKLGEQTLVIDCDVLQADGGTRSASITAASCALRHAVMRLQAEGKIGHSFLKNDLAAVSVGIIGGMPVLDVDAQEDGRADADFNFVFTHDGRVVEVQAGVEGEPVPWQTVEHAAAFAQHGIAQMSLFIAAQAHCLQTAQHSEQVLGGSRGETSL